MFITVIVHHANRYSHFIAEAGNRYLIAVAYYVTVSFANSTFIILITLFDLSNFRII